MHSLFWSTLLPPKTQNPKSHLEGGFLTSSQIYPFRGPNGTHPVNEIQDRFRTEARFNADWLLFSNPRRSSETVIPRPLEMVRSVSRRGLRSALSKKPTAVRWIPHKSANSSCDQCLASRSSRIRLPSAIRTFSIPQRMDAHYGNVYIPIVDIPVVALYYF